MAVPVLVSSDPFVTVVLDKLTFIVRVEQADLMAFDRFTHRVDLKDVAPLAGFRQAYLLNGIRIDVGDKASGTGSGGTRIRVDLNPAHTTAADLAPLGRFLHREWSITRLDVAVDYHGVDLSSALIADKAKQCRNTWEGPGGTETVYLGSANSPHRFRIYDKRKERADAGDEDLGFGSGWWRIESQLRRPNLLNPLPRDLFDTVEVAHVPQAFGTLTSREQNTLVWYEHLTRHPSHWRNLSKSTRSRLRDRVRSLLVPLDPSPSAAFLVARDGLYEDLIGIRTRFAPDDWSMGGAWRAEIAAEAAQAQEAGRSREERKAPRVPQQERLIPDL